VEECFLLLGVYVYITVFECCCCRQPTTANRHHRYIFEEKESKAKAAAAGSKQERPQAAVIARMQELGPRFTLKLLSLQKGTFDSKFGEFEWVHKKEMDTSRRRFHL
jgi:ribosome production factor 1